MHSLPPLLLSAAFFLVIHATLSSFASSSIFVVAAENNNNKLPFDCTDFSSLKPDQRIICENTLPGNPTSDWDINANGDPSIQGYSTDISFHVGKTASFKINTSEEVESYRVDIFRAGYYQGLGARRVATVYPKSDIKLPFLQAPCTLDPDTYEYSCKNWIVTVEWEIPADAASGVYFARPTRTDNKPPTTWRADNSQTDEDPMFTMPGQGRNIKPQPGPHKWGANKFGQMKQALKEPQASHIYFVVRDDSARSDILFQTSDTVWQAYNGEGGASTYAVFKQGVKHRCYKASYDRPLRTRAIRPINTFFATEFPMVQFLEKHGYSLSYTSGVDTDRLGHERLLQHKLFLSVGHDEYWSGPQRANLEAALEKGLHVAFLSGNEMFWRIRWEDNYRTMVVYKETQEPTKLDPNLTEWTGTWRDARDINPVGSKPENAIIGQMFTMNAWRNDPLVVPRRFSSMKWWKGTEVAKMLQDETGRKKFVAYFRGVLGHEMDEDVDNGFRPPGVIHLSETHVENTQFIVDYGSTYDSGAGVHRLTLYRHQKSNAIVFGAGTCQWSWALAGMHDSEAQIPSYIVNSYNTRVGVDIMSPVVDLQQFTVNVFSEMDNVRPFYYSYDNNNNNNEISSSNPDLLPDWYLDALKYDETFKVFSSLQDEKDTVPPTCEIYDVSLPAAAQENDDNDDDEASTKIFVDSPNGQAERFATIYVSASDRGGGVVSGVEVSLDNERWHFAQPIAEQMETPLRSEDSRWVVQVPLRRFVDEKMITKENIMEIVKCRATDDSLNTNFVLPSALEEVVKGEINTLVNPDL